MITIFADIGDDFYYGRKSYSKDYEQAVHWYQKGAKLKDAEALYKLANCYFLGQGIKPDQKQASRLFLASAEKGNIEAQAKAIFTIKQGKIINHDFLLLSKRELLLLRISMCNPMVPQMIDDKDKKFLLAGSVKEEDWIDALVLDSELQDKWVEELVKEKAITDVEVIQEMRRISSETVKRTLHEAFEEIVEKQALDKYKLSLCYRNGDGIEQDAELASNWFSQSANLGYAGAQYELAVSNLNSHVVNQTEVQEARRLQKVAMRDPREAQGLLALFCKFGYGIMEDTIKAYHLFGKAAGQGLTTALIELFFYYLDGQHVKQDTEHELEFEVDYSGSYLNPDYDFIDQLFLNAQLIELADLSGFYTFTGRFSFVSGEHDLVSTLSFKMLLKLAEQGDACSQRNLSFFYFNGYGNVKQDKKEAINWLQKAAEQDDEFSQNLLAICYIIGQGVKQDILEAAKWLKKAGKKGKVKNQIKLADCFLKGQGVKQDFVKAAYWYFKAAEQGYKKAIPLFIETIKKVKTEQMFKFGKALIDDVDNPRGKAEAKGWLTWAIKRGHKEAGKTLANLNSRMKEDAVMSQGMKAIDEKDYKTAIRLFSQAIDYYPKNPQFFLRRGQAYELAADSKLLLQQKVKLITLARNDYDTGLSLAPLNDEIASVLELITQKIKENEIDKFKPEDSTDWDTQSLTSQASYSSLHSIFNSPFKKVPLTRAALVRHNQDNKGSQLETLTEKVSYLYNRQRKIVKIANDQKQTMHHNQHNITKIKTTQNDLHNWQLHLSAKFALLDVTHQEKAKKFDSLFQQLDEKITELKNEQQTEFKRTCIAVAKEMVEVRLICGQQAQRNQNEYQSPVTTDARLTQLEQNQVQLINDFDQRQAILCEQLAIQQTPALSVFYRHFQLKLNELFLAYKALNSGIIQGTNEDEKMSSYAKKGIQLAGEFFSCIPGAELVSTLLTQGVDSYQNNKRWLKRQTMSNLAVSISEMDAMVEETARKLTHCYAEQICHFPKASVLIFAECGVRRILAQIHSGKINTKTERRNVPQQLIDAIYNAKIKQGKLALKHKSMSTLFKGEFWTDADAYRLPGILTPEADYYLSSNTQVCNATKFGFRLQSSDIAKRLGLEKQPENFQPFLLSVTIENGGKWSDPYKFYLEKLKLKPTEIVNAIEADDDLRRLKEKAEKEFSVVTQKLVQKGVQYSTKLVRKMVR